MLIFTRRVGETLLIGKNITVTVLGAKGNQVRIGIVAPGDAVVNREELNSHLAPEVSGATQPGDVELTPEPELTLIRP